MKRSIFTLALAAAMLIAAPSAHAALIRLLVNLSASNEVPPTNSQGTGVAGFILDTTADTLTGHIVFSGLNPLTAGGAASGTTAAHIHCCLASPFLTGTNVGVATVTPAFPGFPIGVLSGMDDFILDLHPSLCTVGVAGPPCAYNTGAGQFFAVNGANSDTVFINGLLNGRTYLNIHTTAFPGGEIRGFVVVPEPMTASLIGLGLAAAAFVSRRRKPM